MLSRGPGADISFDHHRFARRDFWIRRLAQGRGGAKARLWRSALPQASAFPVAVFEVPAIAVLFPMRRHPVHTPALSHPTAVDPNMLAAGPSPVTRCPDITPPRSGNDNHARGR